MSVSSCQGIRVKWVVLDKRKMIICDEEHLPAWRSASVSLSLIVPVTYPHANPDYALVHFRGIVTSNLRAHRHNYITRNNFLPKEFKVPTRILVLMDLQNLGGHSKREMQGFVHLAVGTEGMRCQWAIPPQLPTSVGNTHPPSSSSVSCPPGKLPTQRHAPICQCDCQSP